MAEPELDGLAFEQGKTYYAVIQAIHGDGRLSEKSREIRFKASENRRSEKTQIPIDSQAKVLWHNVNQWVQMVMF